MTSPPATFPNGTGLTYSIVIGGHYYDPAPDQSGNAKIIDPIRHSPQIPYQELPFVTSLRSPTQQNLESTPFPVEPGTVVASFYQTGDPSTRTFVGQVNDINNASQDISGNQSASHWVQQAMQLTTNMRVAPQGTEEVEERKAIVRKKIEKGQEWMHSMTQGIATHAAWWPMVGMILQQVKNIETAKQSFANIPSLSALSGLNAGASPVRALANMNTAQYMVATGNMPDTLKDGFKSMLNIISEPVAAKFYVSDGRVHEQTYLDKATELLSQVRSEGDLVEAFQSLRFDTSLHGLDKLEPVTYTANTPFGNVVQTLDQTTGKVKSNEDQMQKIQQIIQQFMSMLQQFEGGGKTNNKLFAGKEKQVAEVLNRLPGVKGMNRQKLVQDANQFLSKMGENVPNGIVSNSKKGNPFSLWPKIQ